ncbi:D-alanine--D-alanine ligase [Nakamurella flavida]|uniref:D-alanine--D-alanine ligase n=1 Tax=Nakamurella flavida TaxID=363630 RepID=A0A939C2P9_9ACTN|nr:D-alanine--D-alanine ligase [Nakamurella flavida]MBM9476805.1 D-alanine--D-alanine ligase [Nakamurella flavida]MDP9778757.1 D-alanine-D-alanine ligase [Nakamurella flavida]
MSQPHVMVLAGGLTHEREVSLRSGSRIAEALRRHGVEVTIRDADAHLLPWMAEHRPDAAVIALHGGRGENGAIQSILEMARLPYLGTDSSNCRLAWNKPTAKDLIHRAGLPTPKWFTLAHDTFRDLGAGAVIDLLVGHLGLPIMVKPHNGGSALGAVAVHDAADMPAAFVSAFAYGDVVVVEQFVPGTELAITVVEDENGPRALPAVEIVPTSGVFDYEARYTAGFTTYHTPARVSDEIAGQAADLALAAHRLLGLRDFSRTDAIVDAAGVVQFLEVNVSPGLTETSLLPMAVQEAGLELGAVYRDLVLRAIGRDSAATG